MINLTEQSRQEYLAYCLQTPAKGRYRFFSQLARLELGRGPLDVGSIQEALAFIDSRQDCADFAVGGMLRILFCTVIAAARCSPLNWWKRLRPAC